MQIAAPLLRITPKMGNTDQQCEDAFSARYEAGYPAARVKAALADGASEAAFASQWSRILANSFSQRPPETGNPTPDQLKAWLEEPQKQWRQGVPWPRIPWHGRKKAEFGALSTLLGLIISRIPGSKSFQWQATAIGDSCLFLLRDGELELSFPIQDAEQFSSAPHLLCSNPANNEKSLQSVQTLKGECRENDRFLLASDAISYWLLSQIKTGQNPWPTVTNLSQDQWTQWLQEQRQAKRMPNDDATLAIIRCAASED